jgi:anti-sigma regulatory factor (Ser/Thr protein kinase)/GNAT superfamily N-acetyltransferase
MCRTHQNNLVTKIPWETSAGLSIRNSPPTFKNILGVLMHKISHTQLRVPATKRFLSLVQGHVREMARIAGFPEKDVRMLELAAEEAFLNICIHAYPDGTPGDMLISAELLEGELRLEFSDQGLPFDPASLQTLERQREIPGLGLRLIHHAVDEVLWINRGRKGKAMCLVKGLPQDDKEKEVESGSLPGLHQNAKDPAQEPTAHPLPADETFEIRPLQPEDAMQVARLFWLTYGYSYKNEAFYKPEGLLDLVGRGLLFSYVAATEDGKIAGHAGLFRPEPVPMAEMAMLVIDPAYRGRGLMKPFITRLRKDAGELGLFGLSLNPVTSHSHSQRDVIAMGAAPCGLELAACPPRHFKAMGLEDGPQHRESYLHCFFYLKPPPPACIHVPKRHQEMTERICRNLGRTLISSPDGREGSLHAPPQEGAYSVSFDRGLQKGVVRISRADERQWPEILRATRDLMDIAGAEVVHMDLPLAQTSTAFLCEQAEARGFFFAGVWPHGAEDGDMLRLSRLATPLDMGLLRLHSDFAQELAAYVGTEMERAMGMREQGKPYT